MAEKGSKKQDGTQEKVAVLNLAPVTYAISLQYLGEKYVKRDEKKYRCKYELKKDDGTSMETLPQVIANVVASQWVDDVSAQAATPQGSRKNPTTDEVYRIVVTDNHTLSENDWRLLGDDGSPNGDKVSKPDYYKRSNRKWMKDVQPAVPFRIVVRKYQGAQSFEEQIDLDANVKVALEIKDPAEETKVHAAGDNDAVTKFQKDFFQKYNRTDNNPTEGDDNCLDYFKGHRKPGDSKPGVKASKLIRDAKFIEPPSPKTVKEGALEFGKISSKGAYKTMLVKFTPKIIEVEEEGKKVKIGISDFVFNPLPVGGDNYRFLLWIINKSGKDIRDTKVNGTEVRLLDDFFDTIPKPRAYCTGRFVIWRKVDIRLLLTANMLPAADIGWDTIRGYYRHAFTEIGGPIETRALPIAGWRQSLIDVFNGGADTGDYADMDVFRPAGTNPGDPTYNDIYKKGLFPAFIFIDPASIKSDDAQNLCNDILKKAVQALPPVQNPPLTAEKRNIKGAGEGIYMLYAKCNGGGLAGCWLGDGKLFVAEHTGVNAGETNETTTHEMAHGLFLRHSNTGTQQRYDSGQDEWVDFDVDYQAAGAAATSSIQIVDPRSNCFPKDHDQHYSFKCIMTYLQEQHFCGECALTLRFYDRLKVQDKSRFQDRIMEGFFDDTQALANGAKIVLLDDSDPDPNKLLLKEDIPDVAKGSEIYLMAVGPEREYVAAGTNQKGRVNLSCSHKEPASLWSSSNTSVVSIKVVGTICVSVKGKKVGSAVVTYNRNGKRASTVITVT